MLMRYDNEHTIIIGYSRSSSYIEIFDDCWGEAVRNLERPSPNTCDDSKVWIHHWTGHGLRLTHECTLCIIYAN